MGTLKDTSGRTEAVSESQTHQRCLTHTQPDGVGLLGLGLGLKMCNSHALPGKRDKAQSPDCIIPPLSGLNLHRPSCTYRACISFTLSTNLTGSRSVVLSDSHFRLGNSRCPKSHTAKPPGPTSDQSLVTFQKMCNEDTTVLRKLVPTHTGCFKGSYHTFMGQ